MKCSKNKRFKGIMGIITLGLGLGLVGLPTMASGELVLGGQAAQMPVLPDTISGCVDYEVFGIPMFDTGSGSTTITVPGPVLYAVVEWVGGEDTTPAGNGTSTLTINGVEVDGTLAPGGAGSETVWATWYSWHADIGPTAASGQQIITNSGPTVLNISGWTGKYRHGASVTVVYDTGACTDEKELTFYTGVDTYYHGNNAHRHSEMLIYTFEPATSNRTAEMVFSHAGTDKNQTSCRGGAIWMSAGSGAIPDPTSDNIIDRYADGGANSGIGFGINGGVEIVNDPFTSSSMPCSPTMNPAPDAPYEAGHPYPGGASTAPYKALSMTPSTGGDVGGEWAVLSVEVQIPANAEWVAFQMESERDQNGESGAWAGGAAFVLNDPVPVADVAVSIASDKTVALPTETVVLTVSAENVGNEDFTAVDILSLLPSSLIYVSHSSSAGTYSTNTGIWAVGALDVGDLETLDITATVAGDCSDITPTASLSSSTPTDTNSANDSDSISMAAPNSIYGGRVSSGLLAYYPLVENSGTTLADLSGVGTPLDLEVESGTVTFLPSRNGVSVDSIAEIGSITSASKITSVVSTSESFTVEFWGKAANTSQSGPARMVSLSSDTLTRNFTLGQSASDLRFRVRNASSSDNGLPELSANGAVDTSEHHYVGVYKADGSVQLYKDGVLIKTATYGSIQNWNSSYRLLLANEETGDRGWLGEMYMVAIYGRALSGTEISQNYSEGSDISSFGALSNVEISGDASLCVGVNGSFSVNNVEAGASYSWDFGPNATPASASGVGPHSVNFDSLGSHEISVSMTGGLCGDGAGTKTVTVNCQADLAITKTVDKALAVEGETLTYTIEVENVGTEDFTSVDISDVIPASTGFTNATATSGSYNSSNGIWSLSNLNVGDTETLTLAVTLVSDCGAVVNTASLSGSTPADTDASNNSASATTSPQALIAGERVTDGLIGYWPMTEGSGTTINDQSGYDDHHMYILSGNVTWLSGRNGISVNNSSIIETTKDSDPIEDAIEDDSEEFTVEFWGKAANITQDGPARMFSFSKDTSRRNFTLGQEDDDLDFRVRRDDSDSNGTPSLRAHNVIDTAAHHYVGVFKADGKAYLYKDGVQVAYVDWNRDIDNRWSSTDYQLLLANERGGSRPWVGEIYMAALYNKALSASEVQNNYDLGSNPALWAPVANIDIDGPSSVCELTDAVFEIENPEVGATYNWDFGTDAVPATASGVGPHTVQYGSSGLKEVEVTGNSIECGTGSITAFVDVNCGPPGLCEAECGIPATLDGITLWGVESDAGFLFSMSDYNDPYGSFTNFGKFQWNDNGTIRDLGEHLEAFDIGPDGTVYMAYNSDLGGVSEPVLLTYNLTNAVPGPSGNIVTIVGRINIPFNDSGDNVTGLSYDPETGEMYALLKNDGSSVNDRLYKINKDTGSVITDFGELSTTVNGSLLRIRNAEEMEFIAGGRLMISDNYDDKLYEVNPVNGDIIALIDNNQSGGLGGSLKFEGMAYDFINNRLLGTDDNQEFLAELTLENGNNILIADVGNSPLFLTDVEGADFVPIVSVPPESEITITWPTNQTVECPYDGDTLLTGVPVLSGTILCTLAVTNSDTVNTVGCDDVWTRVWTVSDACGRTEMSTQIITVVDTVAPVLVGVPDDVTVNTNNIPPATNVVTAVDDCDLSITVVFNENSTTGTCANSTLITRTWTAADDCGNGVAATQLITVVDYSAIPTNSVTISGPSSLGLNVEGAYSVSNPQPGAVYDWSFGPNATPSTATGEGPHLVSFSQAGGKEVSVSQTQGACVDGLGSKVVVVTSQPDLAITKVVDKATAVKGEILTYTVTIDSVGTEAFTSVDIEDVLPATVVYVGSSASKGTYNPTNGIWNVTSVGVSDSETLTIQASVSIDCDPIVNVASLFASSPADADGSNDSDSATTTPQPLIAGSRITDGLIGYWPMTNGSGSTITDDSGFSDEHFNIDSGDVTWLSGRNGISVNGSSLIRTSSGASDIEDEIEDETEEFSVEFWGKAANITQDGPANMFSFSSSTSRRNFTLGQDDDDLSFRVRHDTSGSNGEETTESGVVDTNAHHYVATFTTDGKVRMYVDGVQVHYEDMNQDIDNTWSSSYRLYLANEATQNREWEGEIYMVALYSKSLSAAEVQNNYAMGSNPNLWAGSGGGGPEETIDAPESVCELEDAVFEILNPESGATYNWDFGTDAVPATASGVGPHTVQYTSQGEKTIAVTGSGIECGAGTLNAFVDVDCGVPGLCEGACGLPSYLDGQTLWGVESDAGFLFSMSDYNDPYGSFTNYGKFQWDDNGTIRDLGEHIEAFDIGPDGTIYLGYNHDLGGIPEPVLLTFNLTNAVPGPSGNIVTIVGNINIPFNDSGDNVTGLSYDPETGEMYALLKNDGSSVNDRLYKINKDTGSVITDFGELKTTVNGTSLRIRNAEEMEFIAGGRLMVSDNYDDKLYEVNPVNGDIIALIDNNQSGGLGGSLKFEGMAYDFINDKLLGTDDNQEFLAQLTLENGNNILIDDVGNSPLFLTDVEGADFVPIVAHPPVVPVVIVWPTNQTVECPFSGNAGVPSVSGGTCALITTNVDSSSITGCTEIITRVWSVSDGCGVVESSTQTITVVDTTEPVLSGVPANTSVSCDAVPSPATVTASDACDGSLPVQYAETTNSGACADSYSLVRVWSAVDNCGNIAQESQTITVTDTSAPVLSGQPADVNLDCAGDVPAAATVTGSDTCDASITVQYSAVTNAGSCANDFVITRTWSASDDCGNSTSHVQVITVSDTTDPVLSGVPGNTTVECDAIPSPATVTATDGCDGSLTVNYSAVTNAGACADAYTITRTWTATDACGNQAQGVQVITVQDTTAPVLVGVPGNITVECDAVPPATNVVTATDSCDSSVSVQFSENTTAGACEDSYTITRTWTATDDCGNQGVGTQVITVQDTTAPVISGVPADANADCGSIPSPATGITATDNCDTTLTVVFTETTNAGACAQSYDLVRTWSATDDCGNVGSDVQIISVTDTTPPTVVCQGDITITSGTPLPTLTATVTDDCDPNAGIASQTPPAGTFLSNGVHIVTIVGSDDCGNTDSCTVNVTVTGPVTIGDYVWTDGIPGFEDGIQGDPDEEPPYEGVAVALYDTSDNLISNTVTDIDGLYQFQPPAGTYYLIFTAPTNTTFTIQDAAGNTLDSIDSDVNTNSGRTANFTVAPGATTFDMDCGLIETMQQ